MSRLSRFKTMIASDPTSLKRESSVQIETMIASDPTGLKRQSSVEAKLERVAFLGKAISLKNEAQGMATSALGMKDGAVAAAPRAATPAR